VQLKFYASNEVYASTHLKKKFGLVFYEITKQAIINGEINK